jgi:hypothetical protein
MVQILYQTIRSLRDMTKLNEVGEWVGGELVSSVK